MDKVTAIITILAILFLVIYFYNQYKKWKQIQSKLTWPREYNQCPDYWISESKGVCRNKFNLGKCPSNSAGVLHKNGLVDFTKVVGGVSTNPNNEQLFNQEMNKHVNLVKKCKWTKQCGSSWEGVDHLCA